MTKKALVKESLGHFRRDPNGNNKANLRTHVPPFQDEYAMKYALQVTRRSNVDGVREVECRMCRAFGHEEKDAAVGSKRKLQSEDIKSWEGPPFRASSFLRHLKSKYEEHWTNYQTLESEEKKERYLQAEAKEEEETPKIGEEEEEEEEEKPKIMEEEEGEGEEEEKPPNKQEEGEEDEEEKAPNKEEEEVAKLDESDGGQEKFVVALERETREGREKLVAAVSEIMAKSAEVLQAAISSMQADYVGLRQRELEVREREVKCMEVERREREEDS